MQTSERCDTVEAFLRDLANIRDLTRAARLLRLQLLYAAYLNPVHESKVRANYNHGTDSTRP